MNLNISKKSDYKLQHNLTNELINLYGINCKFLITEKINKDDLVFGDYSHLKTDSSKIFDVMGLPETSETWDDMDINFSEFGLINKENIRLFFSRKTIDSIFNEFDSGRGFEHVIGNLIVLPNNKIMEITHIEFEVPGISNLFTQNDVKNVYKLSLTTYSNKLVNEVQKSDISVDGTDYSTLENYFDELMVREDDVDIEAEVTPNEETNNVVVDTTEDSVFGRF
jgi:hypothetical protein